MSEHPSIDADHPGAAFARRQATQCVECGWTTEPSATPRGALASFALHLSERHPDVLDDPQRMRAIQRVVLT